jgi:hypothetical protein
VTLGGKASQDLLRLLLYMPRDFEFESGLKGYTLGSQL